MTFPNSTPTEENDRLAPGQRVRVTRGGYLGELGRVRRVSYAGGGQSATVTLDSGTLFYGSARCLKAAAP